ncbi:MAG TPA: N-acetylmuramoyl-L-alanine amidase [Candidatus Merdenecus merdavium]|nr:N-acetylmuramoyl-L-alanine amidase [Candidatus Merdenecus merdavium]
MSNYRVRRVMLALVLLLVMGIFKGIPTQAEEDKTLNLEYLYMDSEDIDDGLGKMVIARVDTEGSQIEKATLEYEIPNTLDHVEVESVENIEGYAAFLLPEQNIHQENLKNLYVVVNGETFTINIETFYGFEDVEEAELEYEDRDMTTQAQLLSDEDQEEIIVATETADIARALEQSESLIPQRSRERKVNGKVIVVLDPGHGDTDPGAVSPPINGVTYYEKDLALKISNATKAELEKYAGVEVYMTRTGDTNPSLTARAKIAIDKKADVLVSQHLNSSNQPNTNRGALVIVSQGNYKPEAAEISKDIARAILKELKAIGFADQGLMYRLSEDNTIYPNGTLADYYGIIRQSTTEGIPSMIVEHGFINNVNEIKELYGTEEKIRAVGVADAKAIAAYYGLTYKNSGSSQPPATGYGWVYFNGAWYYYSAEGIMFKGRWIEIAGLYYYMDDNGKMVTGWLLLNNKWYYMDKNGVCQSGWQQVDNKWYYMDADSVMQTGWLNLSGTWYLLNGSGERLHGWVCLNGIWYYLDPNTGKMVVGWKKIGDVWYYLDTSGAMKTGWLLENNFWYYLDASGAMKTGWINLNNTWYYLNASGIMVKQWQVVNGRWYYFRESGAMATGWILLNNKWYYLSENGDMVTGWIYLSNKWYYATPNGDIYTNTTKTINSKQYTFDGNGVCINPY